MMPKPQALQPASPNLRTTITEAVKDFHPLGYYILKYSWLPLQWKVMLQPNPHPGSPDLHDEEENIIRFLNDQTLQNPDSGSTQNQDSGEKADDAVNYEDLSDDDLPDEEVIPRDQQEVTVATPAGLLENVLPSRSEIPLDELFNETVDSKVTRSGISNVIAESSDVFAIGELGCSEDVDQKTRRDHAIQEELFAQARASYLATDDLPAGLQNDEELLTALWPKFQRNTTPRFMDLLPPRRVRYPYRQPLKPPRALHPSRVSLDIGGEAEKTFQASLTNRKRSWIEMESSGLISIQTEDISDQESHHEDYQDSDHSTQDNASPSWQDLQMLCDDWDVSGGSDQDIDIQVDSGLAPIKKTYPVMGQRSPGSWQSLVDRNMDTPQRFSSSTLSFLRRPETATAQIAKRVKIDLNDRSLLIQQRAPQNPLFSKGRRGFNRIIATGKEEFHYRYNISNDEAYDHLKENHQHKIRGMLGILHVEHGTPALRLQWPFFKTRLEKHEMRSFHRPLLKVNRHEQISFSKPSVIRRKYLKGKDSQTIFLESRDLSLADNSNALLLEYSEEYPMMLSNMSMGSKVINHYRKRAVDDNARPKMDIGELNVLLPADRSPLTSLSHIGPGETISALHNSMYKAPIFQHNVKDTDFLIVRNTTGIRGSSWYLRNIDYLHTVGQEFPSIDVPGPHSRKVTTAAKNRLRMISYRLVRKSKSHRISVSRVTRHFPDSTDMQNRQKMKEFMQFDKDHKEWKMRPGEAIPDEENVRTMVKPEEVCLLESMQVGQQHLLDAGLGKDEDDASEEEELKDGGSVEQRLAPWFTSRNFLNASQGKAMLELHGEGDPSGRGEALSFIKISMKGGFRAIGESAVEAMKDKDMKAQGHHFSFNRQQDAYEEALVRIWDAQKLSLAAKIEHSDPDDDRDDLSEIMEGMPVNDKQQPHERRTNPTRRRDDDSVSLSTRWSTNSQNGKILEITRTVRDRYGTEEIIKDTVRNPRVIRQYLRRRRALESASVDVLEMKPGDDDVENRRKEQRLKKELARLERNKERRLARDKQKGLLVDGAADGEGSPTSPSANPAKSGATLRKCANCGMVGHIKTNKKLCPLLNGTRKPDEGFSTTAFTSGAPIL